MGSHLWRPVFAVLALLALILAARAVTVPEDFGIGERGYMYGWHRRGNEAEWKSLEPKYRPADYCNTCHPQERQKLSESPHTIINCQACHGPARRHPENPAKLTIDRSPDRCLRCHFSLPYAQSGRAAIRGIVPEKHFPGNRCVQCHNPHSPRLGR